MDNDKKKKYLIFVAYITVNAAIIYLVLRFCLIYLLPFIFGFLIALFVQKPAKIISNKWKIKSSVSSLISVLLLYFIILVILGFLLAKGYFSLISLYNNAPVYLEKITGILENYTGKITGLVDNLSGSYSENLKGVLQNFSASVTAKAGEFFSVFIGSIIGALPKILFSLLITAVTGFFIAKDFEIIKKIFSDILKKEQKETFKLIAKISKENILGIVKGYAILSFIAFFELLIGFFVLGVPSPFNLALVTAVVDILPVFGTGSILIPYAVANFLGGKTFFGIGLIAIFVIVTVLRNILEPKIVGKQTGLHPVIMLMTIFVGLKLFSVTGIIILPLIVTVAYHYYEEKIRREEAVTTTQKQHSM